jgi:hypothetical protein
MTDDRPATAEELAPLTEDPEAMTLVLQIMQQSSSDLAWTTDKLVGNLTKQNADLRAELDAIRGELGILFSGPYMPSQAAITRALWPSDEILDMYREATDS